MKRLAVFASGEGTNAENLILYFQKHENIKVGLVVCNRPNAPVLDKAWKQKVSTLIINRTDWENAGRVVDILKMNEIDTIILAGFLWLIPIALIVAYPGKIINIHPALLPKYGGKGMYGKKVHEAVHGNKETETGITIHFVNELYDAGEIIFQKSIEIDTEDSPETIARKISNLEQKYFPKIVEDVVSNMNDLK